MVAWYKHDIAAWTHGTENLDDGAYRVYHVVCGMIYHNEGPIPLNEHGIAGRCRQHILKFRKNMATLIELKKLTLVDGKVSNARTETELKSVGNLRATSAKGGRGSAGVAKRLPGGCEEVAPRSVGGLPPKLLKTNGTATVLLLDTEHHKTRLDETREEKKDAAVAAPEVLKAPDARIYARGREVLGKEAGGLIKKLITAKEGNLALAMAAIETASTKHQPREYIGKIIAGQGDRYDDLCPRTFSSFTVR